VWRVKIANVAVRAKRWNHNIHYHSMLLRAVPANAQSILDVGCDEGTLTRELARRAPTVVGIDTDTDQRSIDEAERQVGTARVDYVVGDFLTHPFNAESFDFIASVATLHHMDATTALTRMRALLRPGGALAVLGLARSDSLRDLPYEAAGACASSALPDKSALGTPVTQGLAAARDLSRYAAPGQRSPARRSFSPARAVAVFDRMVQTRECELRIGESRPSRRAAPFCDRK